MFLFHKNEGISSACLGCFFPKIIRPQLYRVFSLNLVTLCIAKGAFTQSVLRGVIRRRLGYVINKKKIIIKTTILRRVIRRGVKAT